MRPLRRLMGIDYGERRIGVALSDPFGLFARPYAILSRTTAEADLAALREIADREQVTRVIIGLPTDSQGGIGPQAAIVIHWARDFARAVGRPVVFWDESYSSVLAEEMLKSAAGKKRRRDDPLDDIAAAAILQDYLDAGGSDDEPGQPLEAFADVP